MAEGGTATQARKWKSLPLWLRVLLILVPLFVIVGLILPYFLDVDRYRTLVAGVIEKQTGRKVAIAKIRARLLPHVGFVIEDFHLGNPVGFPEGDFVSVESIRGNLAWWPLLLRREFQLSSVELVRPKVALLEDDRGLTNYDFSGKTGATQGRRGGDATAATPASSSFRLDELEGLELTGAELMIGRVSGHRSSPVPTLQLRKLNVVLNHVTLEPFDMKKLQGDASLSGLALVLAGWKDPVEFHSGSMTLRDAHLDSDFRASLGKAADFKGSLHMADLQNSPLNFELSTAELNVDRLLTAQTQAPPSPARPRSGRSELVAKGKFTAERVQWSSLRGNNGSAEIRLFTDRLELSPVSLELYGGAVQLSVHAERTQVPERFTANLQARNVDVGKLLAALQVERKITGTGELTLQLSGPLGGDLKRSLSGSGNFAVRDGHLPAMQLSSGLETFIRATGFGGETPYSLIRGDLAVAQGTVSSKQIHMDSPRATLDMRGGLTLDGALNYDGQVVVVPGAGGVASGGQNAMEAISGILGGVLQKNVAKATVPFAIRGTLSNPKVEPGRGLPTFEQPASPAQPGQLQPQKKQSILDLFRKP